MKLKEYLKVCAVGDVVRVTWCDKISKKKYKWVGTISDLGNIKYDEVAHVQPFPPDSTTVTVTDVVLVSSLERRSKKTKVGDDAPPATEVKECSVTRDVVVEVYTELTRVWKPVDDHMRTTVLAALHQHDCGGPAKVTIEHCGLPVVLDVVNFKIGGSRFRCCYTS
jgi:hypothetical protein